MVVGSESMMAWSWVFCTLRDFQPRVIDIVQTEPRKCDRTFQNHTKKHPAIWGTNQPSKLTFIATGLHASLTFGPKDFHPEKMNGWNPPKLEVWKAIFLFNSVIFVGSSRWFLPILRIFEVSPLAFIFSWPWLVGLRYSFRVYAENRVGWRLRRPSKKVAIKRGGGGAFFFKCSIFVWSVKSWKTVFFNLLFWFVSSHFFYFFDVSWQIQFLSSSSRAWTEASAVTLHLRWGSFHLGVCNLVEVSHEDPGVVYMLYM